MGKGSRDRVDDHDAFRSNYDRIFSREPRGEEPSPKGGSRPPLNGQAVPAPSIFNPMLDGLPGPPEASGGSPGDG